MKRFPIGVLVATLTMWLAFDANADVRLRFSFPTPNQGFPSETFPGSGIWTVSFPSGPSVGEVYRYNILGDGSDTIQHVLVDTGEGTVQLLFEKCGCHGFSRSAVKGHDRTPAFVRTIRAITQI